MITQHSKNHTKLTFHIYQKTAEERQLLSGDPNPNWAMLLVGAEDTLGLWKMTPKKGTLTLAETQQNVDHCSSSPSTLMAACLDSPSNHL